MKSIYEKINNYLFFHGACLDSTVYMPRVFRSRDIYRRHNRLNQIMRSYENLINRQTYRKEQ